MAKATRRKKVAAVQHDPVRLHIDDMAKTSQRIVELVRSELERVIETITGSVLTEFGGGLNPFFAENWNITRQAMAYRRNPIIANHMAVFAGHEHALSARREHARDYVAPKIQRHDPDYDDVPKLRRLRRTRRAKTRVKPGMAAVK